MSEYLVEVYVARSEASPPAYRTIELAAAADELTREGRGVRLERSFFVPEDEVCFYLLQADSDDAVHEATRRAGLHIERVVEAVSKFGAAS